MVKGNCHSTVFIVVLPIAFPWAHGTFTVLFRLPVRPCGILASLALSMNGCAGWVSSLWNWHTIMAATRGCYSLYVSDYCIRPWCGCQVSWIRDGVSHICHILPRDSAFAGARGPFGKAFRNIPQETSDKITNRSWDRCRCQTVTAPPRSPCRRSSS